MTEQTPDNGHPRSYSGRILHVDLSRRKITVEEPDEVFYRRYLGGWGFIGHYLLREVPPGVDPLGPDNVLIFAPGVISGLAISGTARHAIRAKSPLTGAFGASEVGGFWAAEFKRTGFDAVVIKGQSDTPVYLWIHDGEVEIRDASHLWGLTTKDCETQLRSDLDDPRVRVAQIGPGGEKMVRYACVINDLKDAAGRSGMGAVMGSKKLKAIAVRGTGKLEMADPKPVQEMNRWFAQNVEELAPIRRFGTGAAMPGMTLVGNLPINNFRDGEFPVEKITPQALVEDGLRVGMEGCFACAVKCKKVVGFEKRYTVDQAYGGPEYETLGAVGSCCGVEDLEAICKANELCNANSLDTIGTGVTIAFAMECFEKGLLSLEDTGGIDLRFGNGEALVAMVEKIAAREGLGDLLAEGTKRAAETIGGGSEFFAMQSRGQEYPMHEPRLKRGLAVGYAVSPTGADHCHSLHDTGLEQDGPELAKLKPYGILEPIPLEDLGPQKLRVCWAHTLDQVAQNCACTCLFVRWNSEDRAKIVRGATGWSFTMYELTKVAERALNMARVFNAREGFTAGDDWLAPRSFTPVTSGPLADTPVEADKLGQALGDLYTMVGWDRDTGWPTPGKLKELDLEWAVEYLPPC